MCVCVRLCSSRVDTKLGKLSHPENFPIPPLCIARFGCDSSQVHLSNIIMCEIGKGLVEAHIRALGLYLANKFALEKSLSVCVCVFSHCQPDSQY